MRKCWIPKKAKGGTGLAVDSDGGGDRPQADPRGREGSDFLPGAEPGAPGGHRPPSVPGTGPACATFRSVFEGTAAPLGLSSHPWSRRGHLSFPPR